MITGGVLIYGTLDMPHYGDANSAAQTHPDLAVRFIEVSGSEVVVKRSGICASICSLWVISGFWDVFKYTNPMK